MARLESVRFTPMRAEIVGERVHWTPAQPSTPLSGLPQLFWSAGNPWREANHWLMDRATSGDVDLKTVLSNASALHAYANWLEENEVGWLEFPPLRKDRCLVRFRGALIALRKAGEIAPSTASQRMRSVVKFYRWMHDGGLVDTAWPMWQERVFGITIQDRVGFNRTILVRGTDLGIPNRRISSCDLEGGLLPVSSEARDEILEFVREYSSREMFLILSLGFFTGMRLGSICDLKGKTLERAIPEPNAPGLYRLAIGPGASPPVATKMDVTGLIFIPEQLLNELKEYFYDIERLKRESLASKEEKNLLFLTRFGNSFASRGTNKSVAINVEMTRLRKLSRKLDKARQLHNFKFHQSRATFATQLATIAIDIIGPLQAISVVKDALLHKLETTTLKYIKFVQRAPVKAALSNTFSAAFLGLLVRNNKTGE